MATTKKRVTKKKVSTKVPRKKRAPRTNGRPNGGARKGSGPRKGKANTAPGTTEARRQSRLEKGRRMSVIEALMSRRTNYREIDRRLSKEWDVQPVVIQRLRTEVERAWHAESVGVDRESHRVIATKMIENVYSAAMGRRFRRFDDDGVMVVDEPNPNLTAAAIATRTYAKLHGLEVMSVEVTHTNNVIELLKLGETARSKGEFIDIGEGGRILDVGEVFELEESTGYDAAGNE